MVTMQVSVPWESRVILHQITMATRRAASMQSREAIEAYLEGETAQTIIEAAESRGITFGVAEAALKARRG